MSDVKFYERKLNGVIAFQLKGSEYSSTTVMLNQSGNYDPAYHGSILNGMIGNAYAGDYLVYVANGIWTVVKKEEFESMYEVRDDVSLAEYQTGMFKIDTVLIPAKDPEAAKEAFSNMLKETNAVAEDEPAVVFTDDPFVPKELGPSDSAPNTMDEIKFVEPPAEEKVEEKAEPKKKKRKSFRE